MVVNREFIGNFGRFAPISDSSHPLTPLSPLVPRRRSPLSPLVPRLSPGNALSWRLRLARKSASKSKRQAEPAIPWVPRPEPAIPWVPRPEPGNQLVVISERVSKSKIRETVQQFLSHCIFVALYFCGTAFLSDCICIGQSRT